MEVKEANEERDEGEYLGEGTLTTLLGTQRYNPFKIQSASRPKDH